MSKVAETLAVQSQAGRVLVTVQFENSGDLPVYVEKTVAVEKEPWGRLFEIRETASGALITYTGPLVKRGPLDRDDFLEIPPRSKHSNTLDITRSYDFLPGKHTYRLSHRGTYLADVHQMAAPSVLQPEPAVFTHSVP